METTNNHTHNHTETTGLLASGTSARKILSEVVRFSLHFLEMMLAMAAGMGIFHLLQAIIPENSVLAAGFHRGTVLFTLTHNAFMTIPMVIWMILRKHGLRHSLEMGAAMILPVAVVNILCELGLDTYMPWLAEISTPAMFTGMLAAMLYRRSHYTAQKHH